MARPSKKRNVGFNPNVNYFKPRGIPLRNLEEIKLTVEECEAIRLADYIGLSHADAGREMGVSRATFGRIIQKARKNMADALINGHAIRIESMMVRKTVKMKKFQCDHCNFQGELIDTLSDPVVCPECRYENSL